MTLVEVEAGAAVVIGAALDVIAAAVVWAGAEAAHWHTAAAEDTAMADSEPKLGAAGRDFALGATRSERGISSRQIPDLAHAEASLCTNSNPH